MQKYPRRTPTSITITLFRSRPVSIYRSMYYIYIHLLGLGILDKYASMVCYSACVCINNYDSIASNPRVIVSASALAWQDTSLTLKKLSYGTSGASSVMSWTPDCAKGFVTSTCYGPMSKARSEMWEYWRLGKIVVCALVGFPVV